MEKTEIATLANGCFWCTEAIFERLKGVSTVIPGYIGGTIENPTYEQVCTGKTGHAQSIQITFDPSIITYEKILEVFFYTHNPTTLNRQDYDVGTQYRSAIFYRSEKQKAIAEEVKKQLQESGDFDGLIVTEIVPLTIFYPAEDYHKDYFNNHFVDKQGNYPYCNFIILPKVKKLLSSFDSLIKDEYK